MAIITRRVPWTSQPTGAYELDQDRVKKTGTIYLGLPGRDIRDPINGTTLLNPGGLSAAPGGRVMTFNGSQQGRSVIALPPARGLIVAARVRATAAQSGTPGAAFGVYAGTGTQSGFGVGFDPSNNVGFTCLTNNGAFINARSPGVLGAWYTVFIQAEGSGFGNAPTVAYINGQPAVTGQLTDTAGSASSGLNNVVFGSQYRAAGFLRQFRGEIEWASLLYVPPQDGGWQSLTDDLARELYESGYPYNLIKPQTRRTIVAFGGGITPIPGNANGTPASITLSAPAAIAAGKAQASATPANLSLLAPTATASVTPSASAGNATGTPASITLSAPTATAAGKAAASAAPASLNISAPAATAAGKAAATATPASVSLSAPPAIATGKAQATSTPAQITISAPTAIAFGGAAGVAIGAPASVSLSAPEAAAKGSAVASAMYAGVSLSAPTATASATPSGSAGFAFGTPAGISLLPAEATARGAAQASAAYAGISISAPTGTASAADARGFAVGVFAGINITAPTAFARGDAAPDSSLIKSQRYRQIALAIERGDISGPVDSVFLKIGLRSRYRGM